MKITKLISLLLSCVLIVSILVGCRKISGNMSSGDSSYNSGIVYGVVDLVESDDNSSELESIDTDTSSSDAAQGTSSSNQTNSSDKSETNNSSNESNVINGNVASVGDENNEVNSDAPATFIEPDESGNSTTTEITEYNGQTLSTAPDSKTGNVVTVPIAANGSVYYKIKGASNKILTINDSNAYVVYDGTTYYAKDGVVSFTVVSDELSSAQILFEIGNKGSRAQSFTINFSSQKGTWDNKEIISTVGKEISVTIQQGDQDGYWYKYVATKDCTLKIYLMSGTDSGILMATNNNTCAQRSTEIEDELKSDSTGQYVELTVQTNDEIVINIGSKNTDTANTLTLMIK